MNDGEKGHVNLISLERGTMYRVGYIHKDYVDGHVAGRRFKNRYKTIKGALVASKKQNAFFVPHNTVVAEGCGYIITDSNNPLFPLLDKLRRLTIISTIVEDEGIRRNASTLFRRFQPSDFYLILVEAESRRQPKSGG